MKTFFWGILFFLSCTAAYGGPPLEVKESKLLVNIYESADTRISAIWNDYDNKGVAVAANATKSGMLQLQFREGITVDDKHVWLSLCISDVVENVRIDPDTRFSNAFRQWTFMIAPAYLEKTVLTLGSMAHDDERGDFFVQRKYELRKGRNK